MSGVRGSEREREREETEEARRVQEKGRASSDVRAVQRLFSRLSPLAVTGRKRQQRDNASVKCADSRHNDVSRMRCPAVRRRSWMQEAARKRERERDGMCASPDESRETRRQTDGRRGPSLS